MATRYAIITKGQNKKAIIGHQCSSSSLFNFRRDQFKVFLVDDALTVRTEKARRARWKAVFSGVTAYKNVDVHLLDTKADNKIVATFWKHPFARFTLLYSHGNATDLGQMQELFIELRAHLRVNVMSYDYSGYGASSAFR
ncbi:hypothetical protein K1719_029524 [Acacia pycnantha]|nr:hypothetical protein K1719_029524 [Acacia pycnantha]